MPSVLALSGADCLCACVVCVLCVSYYTREVMVVLVREFASPDEEMKKIVLKVVKQCVQTSGVEAEYIRTEMLPEFFEPFE